MVQKRSKDELDGDDDKTSSVEEVQLSSESPSKKLKTNLGSGDTKDEKKAADVVDLAGTDSDSGSDLDTPKDENNDPAEHPNEEYDSDSDSDDLYKYDNEYDVDTWRLRDYFDGRTPTPGELEEAALEFAQDEAEADAMMGLDYDDYGFFDTGSVREKTPIPLAPSEIKCKCGKQARIRLAGSTAQPANVGKEYATCPTNTCSYYAFVEFAHLVCKCGDPARICETKNGMEHNIGRKFAVCFRRKCDYWMWTDGGVPFGEKSQELFNDYMDAGLYGGDDDEYEGDEGYFY